MVIIKIKESQDRKKPALPKSEDHDASHPSMYISRYNNRSSDSSSGDDVEVVKVEKELHHTEMPRQQQHEALEKKISGIISTKQGNALKASIFMTSKVHLPYINSCTVFVKI